MTRKSKEEIIKIYLEVRSIRKTAELTGYSKSGVQYLLFSNKVTTFPRNRAGFENAAHKAIQNLDPDNPRRLVRDPVYMRNLYIDKKMSIPEIAVHLGLSNTTVITGLKQCNIRLRSKKEALSGKPRPNAQGSKNRNWKGGLAGWRKLSRGRLNEYFVRPIMQRDNFTCQWCSSKKNIVVHHHRRSFMQIVNLVKISCDERNIDSFVDAIVKEHTLKDGITICKICHDAYHKEYGK